MLGLELFEELMPIVVLPFKSILFLEYPHDRRIDSTSTTFAGFLVLFHLQRSVKPPANL